MNESCERIRTALEGGGTLDPAAQGHLLACPACRAWLEREERLDALLDAVPADLGPGDLPGRVTSAIDARREAALDRLLDLVPADLGPADLSARVLKAVAAERGVRPQRRLRRLAVPLALAAAAALLVVLVLVRARAGASSGEPRVVDRQPDPAPVRTVDDGSPALESDEELVAYAVEHWELLTDDDLDLLLAGLDPLEQAWIEVAGEEAFENLEIPGGSDGPR